VDDEAATVGAADTTSAATEAGGKSVVITAGVGSYTPKAGDVFTIGSDSFGRQTCKVLHYASASKTITTREFLDAAFPSGSAIEYRNISYALDTTVSAWDSLNEVTIVWTPTETVTVDDEQVVVDLDAMPWTESYEVLERAVAISAMEAEFKSAFIRYYESISQGQFNSYSTRALQKLKMYFETRGRSFSKIIDSEMIKEAWMLQIAILVCMSNSEMFADELVVLKQELSEELATLDGLNIWVDENQDLIKTDEETQKALSQNICRGL
jgi:hypothetical protein